MKVVFCSLNSQYIHSTLAPWCLSAGVAAYADVAVDTQVVEGTVNEPLSAVVERVVALSPDAVGCSCYIWNVTRMRELAVAIKAALPKCFVFFGGPEVGYCAESVLRDNPCVDAVVSGEGERPVAMLLSALCRNDAVSGIDGVSYRDGGRIVVAAPYLTDEIPPSPYTDAYFESLGGRIAYLETSRGCPYSCAFCLSGRCGSARFYPMERVKRELLLLANSGTKTVKLVDRTFNADRRRAREIWGFLMEQYGVGFPRDVCFHFEIAGDLLDEETFLLLSEAPCGLFQMEAGLQSFHEPTLAAVHRKTDTAKLIDNIRKLIACGNIHLHIDLIAGLPYETAETFAEGVNRAVALSPHMLQLGFLKLLHGAPMREERDAYPCDYADTPPYEVKSTPWMTADELKRLHGVEQALDRLYNSGRFRRTLAYVVEQTGLEPFAVLETLATACEGKDLSHISLDAYTALVWDAFCVMAGIQPEQLRDRMIEDRLSANPSAILPPCLRVRVEETKALKRLADTDPRYARPDGVRRGCACLSDGKTLAFADCHHRHPVTGQYRLRYFTADCLTRQYGTLLFDLDGTITDPAEGIAHSVAYALKKFGITVEDPTTLYRFIGPPLLDSFRDFYGFSDDEAKQALGFYREYYAVKGITENRLYDGMRELLRDLQREGYQLLVATSKPELYARRIFDDMGLTAYFDVIAGSDMAETRAEKAQVVAYALRQAGLTDRAQALMIGDRKFDVEGAAKEGLPCAGVLFGYGDRPELEAAGARYIAETVDDLRKLLI